MPKWFHTSSTWANHFVELAAPWLLLLPPLTPTLSKLGQMGGVVQLVFQAILCTSGNLSFLNVLTMLPAIWLFDDAYFKGGASSLAAGAPAAATATAATGTAIVRRHGISVCVLLLLARKSVPVWRNLFGQVSRCLGRYSIYRSV